MRASGGSAASLIALGPRSVRLSRPSHNGTESLGAAGGSSTSVGLPVDRLGSGVDSRRPPLGRGRRWTGGSPPAVPGVTFGVSYLLPWTARYPALSGSPGSSLFHRRPMLARGWVLPADLISPLLVRLGGHWASARTCLIGATTGALARGRRGRGGQEARFPRDPGSAMVGFPSSASALLGLSARLRFRNPPDVAGPRHHSPARLTPGGPCCWLGPEWAGQRSAQFSRLATPGLAPKADWPGPTPRISSALIPPPGRTMGGRRDLTWLAPPVTPLFLLRPPPATTCDAGCHRRGRHHCLLGARHPAGPNRHRTTIKAGLLGLVDGLPRIGLHVPGAPGRWSQPPGSGACFHLLTQPPAFQGRLAVPCRRLA